jgi:hypothetical protein
MNLGANSPANFDLNTSNLFVEAWIYVSSATATQVIISRVSASGSAYDWCLHILGGTSCLRFFMDTATGSPVADSPTNSITASNWIHVAVSYVSLTSAYMFINGVTTGPIAMTNAPRNNTTYPILIGVGSGTTSFPINNGYIQDLRVAQGTVVPVASFTPGQPPFQYVPPGAFTATGNVYCLQVQMTTPAYTTGLLGNKAVYFNNLGCQSIFKNISRMAYTLNVPMTSGVTLSSWVYYNNALPGQNQTISLVSGSVSLGFANGFGQGSTWGISFPTGGTNISTSVSTKTWYNVVLVLNPATNIGSFYVNNVLLYSGAYTPTTPFTSLNLCGTGVYSSDVYIQDLRIYNTALSAIQVQALYANGGSPGVPVSATLYGAQGLSSSMTGTPILSQLSVAPVGAFSLRAVGGVTAKAVQVRRASDNATQDFYADRLGNLLTAPVTGTDLATWLGGATGYVATWYDQLSAGNNATQGTAANQPQINLTTRPYSVIGGGWITVPTFTFNFGTSAGYSLRMVVGNTVGGCVVYKGNTALGWGTDYKHWSFGPGGGSFSETANGLFPYAVGNGENWTYSGTAITTAKTSVTYVSTGTTQNATTVYINASQVGLNGSYTTQTLASDPQTAFVIGNGGVQGSTAPFSGNIYEVIVFPKPLSASDVTILG